MPDTVRYAFYLMLAGAAAQAISIIVSLTQAGTIRQAMRDQQAKQHTTLSPSAINTLTDVTIAVIVIVGLGYVGLWLWIAFMNRAGRHWARIAGTVFFGIQALLMVVGVATFASGVGASNTYSAGQTAASLVMGGILLLIGLVTVILLWNSGSAAYFAQVPYGGYGQPPMPYGGSPYPNPYIPGMTPGLPPQQPGTPGLPPQPPGPGQPPAPGGGPGGFSPPA